MMFCRVLLLLGIGCSANLFADDTFQEIPGQDSLASELPGNNEESSDIKSMEEKIDKLESILLKNEKIGQTNKNGDSLKEYEKTKEAPKLKDENFKILLDIQDKMNNYLGEKDDVLQFCKDENFEKLFKLQKAIAIACNSAAQNKDLIEKITNCTEDFVKNYPGFEDKMIDSIKVLQLIKKTMTIPNGLINFANDFNNTEIINETKSKEILTKIFGIEDKQSANLISNVLKSIDHKNTSAGFCFKVLQYLIKIADNNLINMDAESRNILRSLTDLCDNLKSLKQEIEHNLKEKIPNLAVPYSQDISKLVAESIMIFDDFRKTLTEKSEKVSKCLKGSLDILSVAKEYTPDPKILDYVEEHLTKN